METLELKLEQMKCYLGTNLKILWDNPIRVNPGDRISTLTAGDLLGKIKGFKPYCHPPSDLIKEIEHNGEKFVPIVKIAEMAFSPISKTIITNYSLGQNNNNVFIEFTQNDMDFVCNYSKKWNHFELKKENKYLLILGQYELYQKFFEWHFWMFEQEYFDKGIILDINKIKL